MHLRPVHPSLPLSHGHNNINDLCFICGMHLYVTQMFDCVLCLFDLPPFFACVFVSTLYVESVGTGGT